jgi:N-acyl homoserine lactone hydrolase
VKSEDVVPLHVADVTYPVGHPSAGQTGPVLVFAIRHPQGLGLVDTGIGAGNEWIAEHYQPVGRSVRDALGDAGLDPDAVRLLINTHLHFDHCGQNSAFPGVPIVVQQAEWDVAWDADYTVTEWLDFEGARYQRVTGDAEIVPGVEVLATPGHTPGHQSVSVVTDDGLVLIAGQAAQDARAFATAEPDASVRRLRDLNAAFVHFSHDRAVLKRTPKP